MLPIVKRKALEVPHGLAAIAAAVCLVLAFATDFTDHDSQHLVELDGNNTAELVTSHAQTSTDNNAITSEHPRRQGGESAAGTQGSTLITWFGLRR